MSRRSAIKILLCFVCAAAIGIAAMAGYSKWQAYQAEQARAEALKQYAADIADALDDLDEQETSLFADMAQAQSGGTDSRTVLADALAAAGAPLDTLANTDAPDELQEAQTHFQAAASAYHTAADALTALLNDPTQDRTALREAVIDLLPDAAQALDELKSGITVLTDCADLSLPDSASRLQEALDTFSEDGFSTILSAAE